ncbi:ATP-binding protein [Chloroflexota bacterium]
MNDHIHKQLYREYPMKLGQVLWYMLRADQELDRRCHTDKKDSCGVRELSPYGNEVGSDPIHWWVFKKETDLVELRERTDDALLHVQKLRNASRNLRASQARTYQELVSTLSELAQSHADCIDVIHEYIKWLNHKDVVAPSILFTYRVWGSSRRFDRRFTIEATTIEDECLSTLQLLTEMAFGLLIGGSYTIESVRNEISYEMYDSDPESWSPASRVPESSVITRTSYETISEFGTFIVEIRDSLREIVVDIDKYKEQQSLIHSETFWRSFIAKATGDIKSETQLWDFKKTLDMWHVQGNKGAKSGRELAFCETVASFANADGGVLIIGVTDTPPRQVVGIGNIPTEIERRLKHTCDVLAKYLQYDRAVTTFQQVSLQDHQGRQCVCLVLIIARTESQVSVRDSQNRSTYPVRRETGLERADPRQVWLSKQHLKSDDHDFLDALKQYTYDR